MNNLQIFSNEEFGQIRTITIDGEPWFIGRDVAVALGYKNTKDALISHVDKLDKRIIQRSEIATIENHIPKEVFPVNFVSGDIPNRGLTAINESGLYALIFGSKLESAKRFKHWVTSEVLPTLRKTGTYTIEGRKVPTTFREALICLIEDEEKIEALQNENSVLISDNERMKPKEVFADAVTSSEDCIYMRDLAKLLKQNGIEIGEKRLYKWMRENGYIIKNKYRKNLPSQHSMELGLFQIKETPFSTEGNKVGVGTTTMVTGKGQAYFITKFLREKIKNLAPKLAQ